MLQVDADFREGVGREASLRVVDRLGNTLPVLGTRAVGPTGDRLELGDPGTKFRALSCSLDFLSGTSRTPPAHLAAARYRTATNGELEWLWWAAWFNADWNAALCDVEQRCAASSQSEKTHVVRGIASLFPYVEDPPLLELPSIRGVGRLYALLGAQPIREPDADTDEDDAGWAGASPPYSSRPRFPGGSGWSRGADQLREGRNGGGVGHAEAVAEIGEERQAELGAGLHQAEQHVAGDAAGLALVPPEILRLVTWARMSFSEPLVCSGISGRSSTRRSSALRSRSRARRRSSVT